MLLNVIAGGTSIIPRADRTILFSICICVGRKLLFFPSNDYTHMSEIKNLITKEKYSPRESPCVVIRNRYPLASKYVVCDHSFS